MGRWLWLEDWMGTVMTYLKLLSRYSPWGAAESHCGKSRKPVSGSPVTQPKFKLCSLQIQVFSVTATPACSVQEKVSKDTIQTATDFLCKPTLFRVKRYSCPWSLLSTTPWTRCGNGGIVPPILDFGTRRRWVVSFTFRPLYPRYTLDRRLGWSQSRSIRGS
jgi:hypothetical protein